MIDVIAVGAHPDDVELGIGGTVARLAAEGKTVVLVDTTAGELASGDISFRAQNAADAARILGVAERHQLGLPDRNIRVDEEGVARAVELIRSLRPRTMLLPDPSDRHPDHGQAFSLWREAIFSAGLAKVGQLPPWRPARVYCYGVTPGLRPHVLIDVSAWYDIKERAIDRYRHLADKPRLEGSSGDRTLIRCRDRYYGSLIGAEYAEAIRPIGPLRIDDPW